MTVTARWLHACLLLLAGLAATPASATDPVLAATLTIRVPPGQSLLNPILSDRRLDGDLGRRLTGLVDEIALLEPGASDFTQLKPDGQGRWILPTGALYTNVLPAGHGIVVTRRAADEAQLLLSGKSHPRSCVIPEGRSIIGLAQHTAVPLQAPFLRPASGAIAASYDETQADELAFLNEDGSWHRFIRVPELGWFDVQTSAAATNSFQPGQACYYLRQPGQGPLQIDF
jgi:hypothetical protein